MKRKNKNNNHTTNTNTVEFTKVTIIGAGSFGTSIAKAIVENHPSINVSIWAYEKAVANSINKYHLNMLYLPGITLPSNVIAHSSLREAVTGAQAIIFATPSKVLYDTSLKLKKILTDKIYIGYLTKGFCKIHNEAYLISDTLAMVFPSLASNITAIYGPSHAEEVCKEYHTCLTVASRSPKARKYFATLLNGSYLGCRESEDIRGIDLGSTLKNPAAIAAGMLSMLPQCGDNLAGALISEALNEMIRIGKLYKVKPETIMGISGLGDLVATALSDHSRNRRFGKDISKQIMRTGKSVNFYDRIVMTFRPEYVLEKMTKRLNYLAEGAFAIEPIMELADKNKISIPVYKALYEVLLNKKHPSLLIETVKNPERFEEIYEQTKIQLTERKKGMERRRGYMFNKIILKNTLNRVMNNSDLITKILQYRDTLVEKHKSNSDAEKLNIYAKEYPLLQKLNEKDIESSIKDLTEFYIDDVVDNFNFVIYKSVIKSIKFLYYAVTILRWNFNGGFSERNIQISGIPKDIKQISEKANVVYLSTYRSYFDYVYINMAVDKFGLNVPRFFIERKIVRGRLHEFIIRLMGGYMIDSEKLSNPLYREVVENYLATLIEHGVQIVFFPEIKVSKDGKLGKINKDFLTMIMEALFKNTEEIAMIPITLSYYIKPKSDLENAQKDIILKKMLNNKVKISFSEPIYASDFSSGDDTVGHLSENITSRWKTISEIFPHYILCKFIKENEYTLDVNQDAKAIDDMLFKNGVEDKFNSNHIIKNGINFILRHNIGRIKDNKLTVFNKDQVDYYANLVYR